MQVCVSITSTSQVAPLDAPVFVRWALWSSILFTQVSVNPRLGHPLGRGQFLLDRSLVSPSYEGKRVRVGNCKGYSSVSVLNDGGTYFSLYTPFLLSPIGKDHRGYEETKTRERWVTRVVVEQSSDDDLKECPLRCSDIVWSGRGWTPH